MNNLAYFRLAKKTLLERKKTLLERLKPRKATGPDNIPACFLQSAASELAGMLTFIFQQSLDSGDTPKDWREANVVPIFKKGDRSKPANYRPVSLTAICCKQLEHIIVSNTLQHLTDHNILTDNQHGFRRGRSCETQLIITTDDFARSLDKSAQIDVAVLDFSKAFDKVPHQRLLSKIEYYGVRGNTNRWIASFLRGRCQRVVVDGSSSGPSNVISGVPQGSVLGPLLFLLYINDIGDNLTSTLRLFADDCLLYREITCSEDIIRPRIWAV